MSDKIDGALVAPEPAEQRGERRLNGRIVKLNEKGWGFISSLELPFTRIFFHWTSLKQDTENFANLTQGTTVEFTPHQVEGKGWRAIRIKVLEIKQPEVKTGV